MLQLAGLLVLILPKEALITTLLAFQTSQNITKVKRLILRQYLEKSANIQKKKVNTEFPEQRVLHTKN